MRDKESLWLPRIFFAAVLMCFAWRGMVTSAELPSSQLSESLRARLLAQSEAEEGQARMAAAGEFLQAPTMLVRLYEQRAFRPIWVDDTSPLPIAHVLIEVLREAGRHGLKPAMYHLAALETLHANLMRTPALAPGSSPALSKMVDFELLLTDAFLFYGSHVLRGRINPEAMGAVWFGNQPEFDFDLVQLLQEAVESGRLQEALDKLYPPHPAYEGLLRARAQYQAIAAQGGWPAIPDGPNLQHGDHGPRVAALRNRLVITGELPIAALQGEALFDTAVEQALQHFQRRHGLNTDGIAGPATLAALNMPVEARLRQIELNMERWRWLPGPLGERAILVNIPAFELEVIERGRAVMTTRVVVGQPTRPTPLLSADISYLVFNPHWYVPPNIAIQDKLPLLRRDPGYAARQRFKIFRGGGANATPIDPAAIDWSAVTAHNFPYRLRQDPGPSNALGRVKFMFPNPFHVYLHDTPSRQLFARTERAFSSGCIRVEKPLELAEYLLSQTPLWSRDKILALLDTHKEHTVRLSAPIPVHLLYATAWMNPEGEVEFRKDLYGRDQALEKLLRHALPGVGDSGKLNLAMQH